MLYGFIGRVSNSTELKESLDISSRRTRQIADRVSKATLQNADGFALPGVDADSGTTLEGPVDLEAEMVSLANEQLHFEATARLLQKTYERIRMSLRSR
ncbi:MAG TPA: hypothetical protein VFI91_10110 [Longimicrobiaceae bacterium]|nr:hypothetical protein [Longimicrobiaceae bacterium]